MPFQKTAGLSSSEDRVWDLQCFLIEEQER
jgi:hypothetical protein